MSGLASQGQLRASIVRWSLFTVPACLLLGFLSGQFGGGAGTPWFDALEKPAIFPPPMWFGIAWAILFALMGVAIALVCAAWGARGRTPAIGSFVILFALLMAWNPVFFGLYQMTWALVLLCVIVFMVLVTIMLFWKVRKLAAIMLVPLLGWTSFATLLNYEFLQANPEFDGQNPTQAVQRIEF